MYISDPIYICGIVPVINHWPLDMHVYVLNIIFKLISGIYVLNMSFGIALSALIGDKSTLIQVIAFAVMQQAITWAIVKNDLCRHTASQCCNYFTTFGNVPWVIDHVFEWVMSPNQVCPFPITVT